MSCSGIRTATVAALASPTLLLISSSTIVPYGHRSDSENDALCGAEGSHRTQQSVSSSAAFNTVDIKDSINNSRQLWFL